MKEGMIITGNAVSAPPRRRARRQIYLWRGLAVIALLTGIAFASGVLLP